MPITRPFLKDILEDWFKSEPGLRHFYIRQLTTDWIYCKCIDHAYANFPTFQILGDRVDFHPEHPWIDFRSYPASDPEFLPKLKGELIKHCKHINCDHDSWFECDLWP